MKGKKSPVDTPSEDTDVSPAKKSLLYYVEPEYGNFEVDLGITARSIIESIIKGAKF